MISAIVAVDENWGIGFNGELLEKIPEDLKYFKELTIGKENVVVMGNKTFDSLNRKPLPFRNNIIISHYGFYGEEMDKNGKICYANQGYHNIFMTLETFEKQSNLYDKSVYKNIFIIGGGQIYKELLPLCDRVYVTKIFKSHENVDTYFPDLDEPEMWDTWKATEQSEVKVYDNIMYQFWTYDRIN